MLRTILVTVLVVIAGLASAGLAVPVSAAPVQTADRLLVNYRKLSVDAEKSAESMHNAQLEYTKQRKALTAARLASSNAQRSLDISQKNLDAVRKRVNKVVRASYRGAKINRLYAVLVSDSPQNLLDQMSGLELVSRQSASDLRNLKSSRQKTLAAKKAADDSATTATTAIAAVEKTRSQLQVQRANLNLQAVRIRAIYESMTGQQLAELRGPKFDFDPRLVPKGTSAALVAVQAALTRIGDPYVWGATGPSSFDCSGLMVWAYKQAGQTLPRSSEAQQGGGTSISRDKLQPGDLIIYYSDAHHVGMYVGDGYVIHASTFGVPVKVVPLDKAGPFQSARRYA
ncbi:NlpC/P60 family protein [Gordonia sp. CPCC 205333]|uniref:C40 family peptidase n=1 Tax=Gordonia sp. CPCC 205333 TaxID=3140790 RepID=UPI003AF3D743